MLILINLFELLSLIFSAFFQEIVSEYLFIQRSINSREKATNTNILIIFKILNCLISTFTFEFSFPIILLSYCATSVISLAIDANSKEFYHPYTRKVIY